MIDDVPIFVSDADADIGANADTHDAAEGYNRKMRHNKPLSIQCYPSNLKTLLKLLIIISKIKYVPRELVDSDSSGHMLWIGNCLVG